VNNRDTMIFGSFGYAFVNISALIGYGLTLEAIVFFDILAFIVFGLYLMVLDCEDLECYKKGGVKNERR